MSSIGGVSAGLSRQSGIYALQANQRLLEIAQQRVATGKRVNNALDNPAAFFTASGMSSKASVLKGLLDTYTTSQPIFNAAGQGSILISGLLNNARSIVAQALATTATISSSSSAASVSGTGTLSPDAAASLSSVGTFTADAAVSISSIGTFAQDAAAAVAGTGTLAADAGASASGTGTLAADASAVILGSGNVANVANFINAGIPEGKKFTLQINGVNNDIVFGATAGRVNTAAALLSAIISLGNVTASYDGSGRLRVVGNDATVGLALGGTAAEVTTVIGISNGSFNPTNILSQGVANGKTLTVQVGSGATQTITFGTSTGQVQTLSQLQAALSALTGLGTASVNLANGGISLTTASAKDTLTVGGSVTLSKFGLTAATTNPTNLLTQGISQGQTLTVKVGANSLQTITFGTGAGEVQTLGDLQSKLATLSSLQSASANLSNGGISLAGTSASEAITIDGTVTLSKFGLSAGTTSPTNLLTQGVSQGQTLTVKVGANPTQTIVFGTLAGQVQTLGQLQTQVAALTGLTTHASSIANGGLTLAGSNATDSITIGGTATLSKFGLSAGTTNPTNLLSQGISQGQTLTVKVGSGGTQTITFGTGAGQVQTLAQLQTSVAALTGLSVRTTSLSNGSIQLTATNSTDAITIGGTATLSKFGLSAGATNPTNLLSQGVSQGQTLTVQVGSGATQTITFGTGAGEVQTLTELQGQLNTLTALSIRTVNAANGGISLTAASNTDTVTIGGTATLSKLGLTAGTINPTGTNQSSNNPSREQLRVQFNDILSQIDRAATGSGYNGINLLTGGTTIINLNEKGTSSIALKGFDATSAGLGIATAASNDFNSDANVSASLAQVDAAVSRLGANLAILGSQQSTVQSRQDFANAMVTSLQSVAESLTAADMNAESSAVLALRARKQYIQQALSQQQLVVSLPLVMMSSREDQTRSLFGLR